MATVIQFPDRSSQDDRRLSLALESLDLAEIMRLALYGAGDAVRVRAARWLAEVMNIRIVA